MFPNDIKILIVDDMMTMRKLVSKVCKELGYTNLTEASDGVKAWDAVNTASPPFSLIISDWNMPNATGLDLLKRVRGDSRFLKTPFLMVTAEAETHQVREAVQNGVDQYLVKPFDTSSLKEKLIFVYKKYNT